MQSWLYGKILGYFDPAAVELHSSRGIETQRSKLLLRWTVVLTDILGAFLLPTPQTCSVLPVATGSNVLNVLLCCTVFFPAVFLCACVFTEGQSPFKRLPILAIALFQPPAVLIDHGHFQYNNIGLGLSVRFLHKQPL